jgi:subtilisin family serine protease
MIQRGGALIALLVWGALLVQISYAQAPFEYQTLRGEPHPKMETALQLLAEQHEVAPMAVKALAAGKRIDLLDDSVRVVIEPLDGRVDSVDTQAIEQLGGEIELSSGDLLRVRLPLDRLIDIADLTAGIAYMRLPYQPRALVVSEGVAVVGADDYHTAGYLGQGTKVAVIDLGFTGANTLPPGELPAVVVPVDYTGTGVYTGTNHGTAVAEIVADVAPQAGLYLLKISDEVELANAVSYCITNGIDVIVHSAGWYNTCFYDGTGYVAGVANNARDNGILWVNAAGNEAADGHWQGTFFDGDTDGNLAFGAGSDFRDGDGWDEGINVTLAAGDTLNVFLTWNDWDYSPSGGSSNDYNLRLINSAGTEVALSWDVQDGDDEPKEQLSYAVSASGTYEIQIIKTPPTSVLGLELFLYTNNLANTSMQYHQASSSIMTPANSSKVLAVGAMNHAVWQTGPIEADSSRGPSNTSIHNGTSVIKPDIVGPDEVTTFTGVFHGTSAAAPHVGGAAALLLSEAPSRTAAQLQTKLEADAVDMGTAGKDNTYGSGRLRLQVVPPPTAAAFRVTAEGDVLADGTVRAAVFSSGSADVAEWISVSEPVEPGDVVVLDAVQPGTYRLADGPCSDRVAGVVSTEPGVVLGRGLEAGRRALLALVGIVPVKVTNEGGPILPGDLLVTSSTVGSAMRWAGSGPCPCALVGKALGPMTDDKGVILVLLTAH